MSTFEKVRHSDQRLYGPRKLLLCGFPAVSQSKFRALLEMLAIGNLPLVWITADQAEVPIQEALSLADGTGAQSDSDMERGHRCFRDFPERTSPTDDRMPAGGHAECPLGGPHAHF